MKKETMLKYVRSKLKDSPELLDYYSRLLKYKKITPNREREYKKVQLYVQRKKRPLKGAVAFKERNSIPAPAFNPPATTNAEISDQARLIVNGYFDRIMQYGWAEGATVMHEFAINILENYGYEALAKAILILDNNGVKLDGDELYHKEEAEKYDIKLMKYVEQNMDM